MITYGWIVVGLVTFDALMIAFFVGMLKTLPPLNRQGRIVTAIAISGFVAHALMFFDGVILYVQLATLAIMYMLLLGPLLSTATADDGSSVE